jgi:hypothetical protein
MKTSAMIFSTVVMRFSAEARNDPISAGALEIAAGRPQRSEFRDAFFITGSSPLGTAGILNGARIHRLVL